MLQDVVVHPQEQLQIEEISSPLSAQIFEFCESELFSETLQSSEVASTYNGFLEDHSSLTTNIPFNTSEHASNIDNNGNTKTITASTTKTPPITTTNSNNNLSIIFLSSEDLDNNVSDSVEFSPSPPFSAQNSITDQHGEFDLSLLQSRTGFADNAIEAVLSGYSPDRAAPPPPLIGPSLPSLCEDDCLSSMPSYMTTNLSLDCSILDLKINSYRSNNLNAALSNENSGIFYRNLFLSNDLQPQELDNQGDIGGIFSAEPLPPVYHTDLQRNLANRGVNSTALATEINGLEDSTFKVGKLSVEERKEKIHRYMKKRNERNFSKKIKYACRKTLADSRPRVRGRFAKNDEFGETTGTTCSNHEEDTDDNVRSIQVMVKDEEDMVDSSDIFAHISGVNSFKYNYSAIQSWI